MRSDKVTNRGLAAPRLSVDQFLGTIDDANTANVNFLKTDLETALTFSRMALETSDPVKKNRTTRAARRAYDTITRLRRNVHPRQADADFLKKNLGLLKSDLLRLGESV